MTISVSVTGLSANRKIRAVKFDKQQILLVCNKYISYVINIVIIAAVAAGVGVFVWGLYIGATS